MSRREEERQKGKYRGLEKRERKVILCRTEAGQKGTDCFFKRKDKRKREGVGGRKEKKFKGK